MAFPSSVQWSAPTYQAWTCALMSLKASTLFKSRTQWSGCRTKPNASIFKDVVVFTDMQFTAGKHPVGKKQPRKELLIWSKRKKKKKPKIKWNGPESITLGKSKHTRSQQRVCKRGRWPDVTHPSFHVPQPPWYGFAVVLQQWMLYHRVIPQLYLTANEVMCLLYYSYGNFIMILPVIKATFAMSKPHIDWDTDALNGCPTPTT